MLDSSVFIWAERRRLTPSALYREVKARHGDSDICLSVITAGELLHGVWRADSAARRAHREQYVESVLSELPVIALTVAVMRVFAELDAKSEETGERIPVEDLLIAATALFRGDGVLTGNTKDFKRVRGLSVTEWK